MSYELVYQDNIIAPDEYFKSNLYKQLNTKTSCGPVGFLDRFIADSIFGVNVTLACSAHDFMYNKGETQYDKTIADELFHLNLKQLIKNSDNESRVLAFLRHSVAYIYKIGVNIFGHLYFNSNQTYNRRKL
jgi:hypothetical protein